MNEREIGEYKLSAKQNQKEQSFRISLLDDKIKLTIMTISEPDEKFSNLISLPQLRESCEIFNSTNTINEAIEIIKSTIEAGNVLFSENCEDDQIFIKFIIKTNQKEYPSFDIALPLEKNLKNEENKILQKEVSILPTQFDYQGNKNAEMKYGKTACNTTEYFEPIIKSNVNEPNLVLEFIEPVLQVHYPDGTTKTTQLPPRLQTADGKVPKMDPQQIKSIHEQMTKALSRNKIGLPNQQQNYLNQTQNNYKRNTNNKLIAAENNTNYNLTFNNKVRLNSENFENNFHIRRTQTSFNLLNDNINQNKINNLKRCTSPLNNALKSKKNEVSETNSSKSKNNNDFILDNYNHIMNLSPQIKNNRLNMNNNIISYNQNTIIQEVPKIINNNSNMIINLNTNMLQKGMNRTLSSPNMISINKIPNNEYQINPNQIYYNIQNNQNQPYIQNQIQNINLNIPYEEQMKQKMKTVQLKNSKNYSKTQSSINNNNYNQNNIQIQKNLLNKKNISQGTLLSKEYPQDWQQQKKLQNKQIGQLNLSKKQNLTCLKKNKSPNPSSNYANLLNRTSQSINLRKICLEQKLKQIQESIQASKEKIQKVLSKSAYINQQEIGYTKVSSIPNSPKQDTSEQKDLASSDKKKTKNIDIVIPEQDENDPEDESNNLYRTETNLIIFRNGILYGIIQKYSEIDEVVSKIQITFKAGVKFMLLFRASEHGDKAKTFHEKCDHHSKTLTLIETTGGARFGGFTTKNWDGKCQKKIDNDAFVFNIDKQKIYNVIKNEYAVGAYPKFGPVFFGCQIRVYDEFFKKESTTCMKGLNYRTKKDFELNNGQQKYIIKEMEVYDVEVIGM